MRFAEATIKSSKSVMRKSRWRNKSQYVFGKNNKIFMSGVLSPASKEDGMAVGLKIALSAKPMMADLVHWHAQDLRDNADLPLSFRASAAHQARSFTIHSWVKMFDEPQPEQAAMALLQGLEIGADEIAQKTTTSSFSEIIRDAGQERKHAALYWACLVLEDKMEILVPDIEKHYLETSRNPDIEATKAFLRKIQKKYIDAYESYMEGTDPYWTKIP